MTPVLWWAVGLLSLPVAFGIGTLVGVFLDRAARLAERGDHR